MQAAGSASSSNRDFGVSDALRSNLLHSDVNSFKNAVDANAPSVIRDSGEKLQKRLESVLFSLEPNKLTEKKLQNVIAEALFGDGGTAPSKGAADRFSPFIQAAIKNVKQMKASRQQMPDRLPISQKDVNTVVGGLSQGLVQTFVNEAIAPSPNEAEIARRGQAIQTRLVAILRENFDAKIFTTPNSREILREAITYEISQLAPNDEARRRAFVHLAPFVQKAVNEFFVGEVREHIIKQTEGVKSLEDKVDELSKYVDAFKKGPPKPRQQ
jgi:hypothetical protein